MLMNASQLVTITVPATPTDQPAAVAIAMDDRPMRVLIDNVGVILVRLAFSSSSLGGTTADGSSQYQLIPGASRVLVLAPGQKLYAVANGVNGSVSVHTSDALPFEGGR